ncbi:MAG TPA: HXXEE domain-containing protein [Terriglobia bacterium]|nr:HXXEE domain-containing protein [Terriglobia bacterium]
MEIRELLWPGDQVVHISHHGVLPEEVEEVCFGEALVQPSGIHRLAPSFREDGFLGDSQSDETITHPSNTGSGPREKRDRSTISPRGFVILNVALVTFGVWCLVWPVRKQRPAAVTLAWFWIAIELVNGLTHTLWSLFQRAYTPGVATAPALFFLALYLARQLRAVRSSQSLVT